MREDVYQLRYSRELLHLVKQRKWFTNVCLIWVYQVAKMIQWKNRNSRSTNFMHFTTRFALETILKIYFVQCKLKLCHTQASSRAILMAFIFCALFFLFILFSQLHFFPPQNTRQSRFHWYGAIHKLFERETA